MNSEDLPVDLLSVDQALARITAAFQRLPSENIPLIDALGRVAAEDVIATAPVPAFANSSMDGFAVRAADVQSVPMRLPLVMDIPAGVSPPRALQPGEAARIMTGAPLPEGADAVVPVEDSDQHFGVSEGAALPPFVTLLQPTRAGAYVRPAGEDVQPGRIVIHAGEVLRPAMLGMLAAIGCGRVPVVRQPRVALMSTGDELVGPEEALRPGQIRDSNSFTLFGQIIELGGQPLRLPTVRDTLADARRLFGEAVALQPDLILSSAGVSVGAYDVVRTVLEEMGEMHLWRLNLRPGKPLTFGHLRGIPFFGLPGNPVSAMVTFEVLVRPALLRLAGGPDNALTVQAAAAHTMRSDGRRSYVRVTLRRQDGVLTASETGTQSSGALMSMVLADGLMILPEGVTSVAPGDVFPVRLLKPLKEEWL